MGPLLTGGAERWQALLEAAEPGAPFAGVLERAVTEALSPGDEYAAEQLGQTRGLLRAAQDDPALRAVWYRVNQDSEERLLPVLTRLAGDAADPWRSGSPRPPPRTRYGSPWRPGRARTPRRPGPAPPQTSRCAACTNSPAECGCSRTD